MKRQWAEVQIPQQLFKPSEVFDAPLLGLHPCIIRCTLERADFALKLVKHFFVVIELHHAALEGCVKELADRAQVFPNVINLFQHTGDEGQIGIVVAGKVVDGHIT